MIYRVVHHVERCTGCEECVKACAEGHGGLANCLILKVCDRFAYFACLQCKKPQCAAVCPVGALVRKGEIVAFYQGLCVGCKNCLEACPWGVPQFNLKVGTIGKCDLCWQRVEGGELPYCVASCSSQALELKKSQAEGG